MPELICDQCGLPVVPFGGEDVCECPSSFDPSPEGSFDPTPGSEEWDDDRCGDPACSECYP